jgi:hypothetical protein
MLPSGDTSLPRSLLSSRPPEGDVPLPLGLDPVVPVGADAGLDELAICGQAEATVRGSHDSAPRARIFHRLGIASSGNNPESFVFCCRPSRDARLAARGKGTSTRRWFCLFATESRI